MKKKIIVTIVLLLFFAAFATMTVIKLSNEKTIYNTSKNIQGNTSGNLNNGGLFCEKDGTIYFANPSQLGCLYAMNSDCTNIRRLNNDCVQSINVDENYIYYSRIKFATDNIAAILNGHVYALVRTSKNASHPKLLDSNPVGVVNLCGNYLYYQHYTNDDAYSFYRVKIDGEENECISKNGYIPACADDGIIYYTGVTDDHNIYRYSTTTGVSSLFIEANAYMVDVQGSYVYYIDLSSGYRLVRVNVTNFEKEYLTSSLDGKCVRYNIYDDKIFYAMEGTNSGLYRMDIDAGSPTLLYQGDITSISCTSQYTFFQIFGSDILLRVSTKGSTLVEQVVLQ